MAAAGPRTCCQGLFAVSSLIKAMLVDLCSACSGRHSCQIPSAHSPMGSRCASYAGSVRPRGPPSATARAKSRSWPHVPLEGAAAAAAALCCLSSVAVATPVMAWPYVTAARPPVRRSRLLLTFAAARRRNRAFFAQNCPTFCSGPWRCAVCRLPSRNQAI